MKRLNGVKMLVVDDDEAIRELLEDMFAREGAQVVLSENGALAFSWVQKNQVDVVFTDVRMPGGDGIELARNICRLPGKRPLVFMCTGFCDLTPAAAKEISVSEVFEKPFDHKYIVTKIASLLEE